jgi:hypothetical protein
VAEEDSIGVVEQFNDDEEHLGGIAARNFIVILEAK